MRTNKHLAPENRPIFRLRIVQFREQNLHEEPDKQLPTPENPAFPDFRGGEVFYYSRSTRTCGVHRSSTYRTGPSILVFSGICGIFGNAKQQEQWRQRGEGSSPL
jgi:hypothetical protein